MKLFNNILNNILNFKKCIFFKYSLLKNSFKYKPYDYSYMLEVIKSMAEWNLYEYKTNKYTDLSDNVSDMKKIIELINIINGKRKIITYKNIYDKTPKLNFYINFNNSKRFLGRKITSNFELYAEDLYIEKALNIFSKLIKNRMLYWWD